MTVTAYTLAGLIAAAIVFIGTRFIVAPRVAAAGYGVLPDLGHSGVRAYLSVKGVRDIASGLFVVILMVAGTAPLLGSIIVAATIIPIADTSIVLRHGGSKAVAWGVHGSTAAFMLVTSALLLIA